MFGSGLFGTNLFGTSGVVLGLPPTVNAGVDQILLPGTTATTLTGIASDPDGDPLTYLWSKESGPDGLIITDPFSASTSVTDMLAGNYVFRLTVSDGVNTVYDELNITVLKKGQKGIGAIYIKKRGVLL